MHSAFQRFQFRAQPLRALKGTTGTNLDQPSREVGSAGTPARVFRMTCLTLLLALNGCGSNAFAPQTVEIAQIRIASSAEELSAAGTPLIYVGGTLPLIALDDDGNEIPGVEWSTSDIRRAGISGRGIVNGLGVGDVTISASAGGQGKSQGVRIEKGNNGNGKGGNDGNPVVEAVASVKLSPASFALAYGGTVQLVPTVTGVNGTILTDRPVTWSTSNTAIATVSSTGVVTATGSGAVQIAALSEEQSGIAEITVAPQQTAPTAASVTVSPASSTLSVGGTVQLSATVKSSTGATLSGQTVTWSSSNSQVATVSSSGMVTGKASGLATITATSGGKSGKAEVLVPTSSSFSGSGAPQPRAGDRMLLDTRAGGAQDIQAASDEAKAESFLDYTSSGVKFTTDFDGKGTHAYRHEFAGRGGECVDVEVKSQKYLPSPLPKEVYVSWKMWMGRTSTGGGIGEIGHFDATSEPCVADGAGRKIMRFLRDVPDRGSAGSFDLLWNGGAPARPSLGGGSDNRRYANYAPEDHLNRVLDHTIYLKASSAPGTADGVVKIWVNGALVGEWYNQTLGPEAFHRFQWPQIVRGPVKDMTEYWWDIAIWQPQ